MVGIQFIIVLYHDIITLTHSNILSLIGLLRVCYERFVFKNEYLHIIKVIYSLKNYT